MNMHSAAFWIYLLALNAIGGEACTYTISRSPPSDTSSEIESNFLGYAFECATFVRYAQYDDGSPNKFTLNMMDSLRQRTGAGPVIRVGGTVSDYARYFPDQQEPAFPEISRLGHRTINFTTVGPSYFALPNNFKSIDATFSLGVPQVQVNVSETVAWAEGWWNGTPHEMIDSIEVGNEPDLFDFNKAAPTGPLYYPAVTNQSYVDIATERFAAISQALDIPNGTRLFQAFETAMHFGGPNAWVLSVPPVWNLGIDASHQIKSVSHHWYQTQNGTAATIGRDFMNHSAISSGLEVFRPWIEFLNTVAEVKIPFVLDEASNSLNGGTGYQDVFATTLWQVDWELYAMYVGISRINYQAMYAADYLLFNPLDSDGVPQQAYAPWYAQPFVADFIGIGGSTRMSILQQEAGTQNPNIVGYVAFEENTPKRVALINFAFWTSNSSQQDPRPSDSVTFTNLDTEHVTVRKLTSPLGASALGANITYGGSQWLRSSEGKEVENVVQDTMVLEVQDGTVVVDVDASSAVLVLW